MAYNKQILFDKAKEQIVSKRLIFVEEVASFIGISKQTLYEFYPIGSDEMDELKKLIEDNKISLKTSMRKKWYDSDNATLQMGLMKLIANPEEHKRLSQTFVDSENVNTNKNFDITKLYDKETQQSLE
jgi:hypothetical protein